MSHDGLGHTRAGHLFLHQLQIDLDVDDFVGIRSYHALSFSVSLASFHPAQAWHKDLAQYAEHFQNDI